MTVQHVISNVLNNTDAEYCKNWAVTEVRETGDGVWDKVCLLFLLLHHSATPEILSLYECDADGSLYRA
jgi:hypothetical protein